MFGRVINGVADGVVAMNALKLGSACDCMVAIYIRVFPTRRAGVGRAVNWEPQPVLKRDSEILWDDRETKIGIRNSIKKCARLGERKGEQASGGPFITCSLNFFEESEVSI